METKPEVLALVPARGGSKGIPGKNLRTLCGKPLIAWSIEHAIQSKLITRVICTTDSSDIAEVARSHGAEVPFLRPADISGDEAVDYTFHAHALEWLAQHEGYRPDLIVQLRPTHPIRTPQTIDAAIRSLWLEKDADSLRAIRQAIFTPYKMWTLANDGMIHPLLTEPSLHETYNMPRAKLPKTYQQDGYIDITRAATLERYHSTTGAKILSFGVDAEPNIDIDYEADLLEAEVLMAKYYSNTGDGNGTNSSH